MARSFLTSPADHATPADIATALVGVHAQILTTAELSIGRRISGATRADVQGALWDEPSVVKTFGPRGTVHLVATADLPMWTGASHRCRPRRGGIQTRSGSRRIRPEQQSGSGAAGGDIVIGIEDPACPQR
jgi:hypothetical protein